MVGFVAVPTKDIPNQAGNSLAYNPSEFFNVRNEKFKNVSGNVSNMQKFGLGLIFLVGVGILIKKLNKKK